MCPSSCKFNCKSKITLEVQHTYFSKFWGPRLPEARMAEERFTTKRKFQAVEKNFTKALNSNGSFTFFADEACEIEICESAIAAMLSLRQQGRFTSQWRSAKAIVSKRHQKIDLLGETTPYATLSLAGFNLFTNLLLLFHHFKIHFTS